MPIFLTQDQCYRVLQRELPEDVYPDTAPSGSFPTADHWATAGVFGTAYANLSRIYDNYFAQYADEKIADWEVTVFGVVGDSTKDLPTRQARVLRKLRSRPGIKPVDMQNAVIAALQDASTLAQVPAWLLDEADLDDETPFEDFTSVDAFNFEIIEWGNETGSFVLDYSQLGVETFLSQTTAIVSSPLLCAKQASDFGLTTQQWLDNKQEAYTYEVRLYDQTLSLAAFNAIDQALTVAEPARSGHVITDGLTDGDKISGST